MNKRLAARLVGIMTALAIALSGCGPDEDCKPDQAGFENCTNFGCDC